MADTQYAAQLNATCAHGADGLWGLTFAVEYAHLDYAQLCALQEEYFGFFESLPKAMKAKLAAK